MEKKKFTFVAKEFPRKMISGLATRRNEYPVSYLLDESI